LNAFPHEFFTLTDGRVFLVPVEAEPLFKPLCDFDDLVDVLPWIYFTKSSMLTGAPFWTVEPPNRMRKKKCGVRRKVRKKKTSVLKRKRETTYLEGGLSEIRVLGRWSLVARNWNSDGRVTGQEQQGRKQTASGHASWQPVWDPSQDV
jgi:hypothetical protein